MTFSLSLFICVLSDKRREELELMIAEWEPARGFEKKGTRRRST